MSKNSKQVVFGEMEQLLYKAELGIKDLETYIIQRRKEDGVEIPYEQLENALATSGKLLLGLLCTWEVEDLISGEIDESIKKIKEKYFPEQGEPRPDKTPPILIIDILEHFVVLEGKTRALVAKEKGFAILAYIPEKIVKSHNLTRKKFNRKFVQALS